MVGIKRSGADLNVGRVHVFRIIKGVLMEMAFNAVFSKEAEGGYSALCPELGVASQCETIEEAEENLKEACELYIESAKLLENAAA